jgi:hypothetical protein
MNALGVSIVSFISSALLFLLSVSTSFMVETVQPNGLPEIYQPYGLFSFVSSMAALWFLVFGITLLGVALRRRPSGEKRRPFLGSGLVASGVFSILFAAFVAMVNLQDEGPRCLGGCASSLLQYYQTVYLSSGILAILGVAAAFFGSWWLVRRRATAADPTSAARLPFDD